jgi:hypothetical protein
MQAPRSVRQTALSLFAGKPGSNKYPWPVKPISGNTFARPNPFPLPDISEKLVPHLRLQIRLSRLRRSLYFSDRV